MKNFLKTTYFELHIQTIHLNMLPLVYLYNPGTILLLLLVFTDYVLATVEKDVQEGFNQENRKFGNARY